MIVEQSLRESEPRNWSVWKNAFNKGVANSSLASRRHQDAQGGVVRNNLPFSSTPLAPLPVPLVAIQYRFPLASELQVIEAHYGLRQVFLMMTRNFVFFCSA